MSIGQIVQVIGAVVDIEFPRDAMPKIYEALVLKNDEADSLAENGLTFEVDHLLGDGVDDFLAAVADVDGPHAAGHGVKIGLAVDVGDAHPFALHINGGRDILVLGQVVPNVLFGQSDQFSFIVSHGAFLMK